MGQRDKLINSIIVLSHSESVFMGHGASESIPKASKSEHVASSKTASVDVNVSFE
jgi:hypothetical protein